MTSPKRVEPGYVEIKKLLLNTGVGEPINLTQLATDVDIYESIFQPYIIAEITIVDGVGLTNKFPNIDEMTVDIEFTIPDVEGGVNYKLAVMDRQHETASAMDKSKVYKLVCISEEVDSPAAHESVRLYDKANLGDLVAQFILAIGSKKGNLIEQTDGIVDIKLTNVKPFQIIDWARRRALSLEHESHSYVFFENKYGYRFVTIEKLIDDGSKRIGDKIFQYDSAVNIDSLGTNWRNILHKDSIVIGKGIKQQLLEGNKPTARVFNLQEGTYTKEEKQEKEYNFKQLDSKGFGSTTSRKAKFEETKTTERFVVVSDSDDVGYTEKLLALQAYVPSLLSNITRIFVYGDPSITVGEVIKCNFPDIDGLTTKKTELSKTQSGNYLITKLRHKITLAGPPVYTQSMEIIKTGFGQGEVD